MPYKEITALYPRESYETLKYTVDKIQSHLLLQHEVRVVVTGI
jgi:hypothetical protein